MNEDMKQEIVSILKDFFKGVLRDTIMIIIFFTMLTLIIGDPAENFDLKDNFLIEKALECIAGFIFLRVIFTALNVIVDFRRNKKTINKLPKEELQSLNMDYSQMLEHYKDVFDLGSPILTKYLNDPNGAKSMNQDVFVAGLADLIRKRKVKIDGPFLVVLDRNVSLECEKFLLNKIKDGRFAMGTESSFYSNLGIYAAKDLADGMKLLEKNKPKHKGHGKMIIFAIIFLFFCAVFADEDSYWYDICEFGAMVLSIYGIVYASSLSRLKPTQAGAQLNRKIEGLKKHLLKSYEVIGEDNEEELMNQYLLHTIAFGHNPKMVEMYMKYVDITPEPEE